MYLNQILGDNHMNQTINQLERERKEKIRNLNPEETEAYIDSLNDKIYTALADKDYDKQNYYNDKLVEAGLILKERYSNIPMVVSVSKISYGISLIAISASDLLSCPSSISFEILERSDAFLSIRSTVSSSGNGMTCTKTPPAARHE